MIRPLGRVAVIGAGIAGLTAARLLRARADVTVFESADRPGGHTHTVNVEEDGRRLAIDTGFIVFNRPNYPLFSDMLDELGVTAKTSDMSFSVRCERTGLEYNGTSLNRLFVQRRNLLRPSFHGMIRDILRFHREAPQVLAGGNETMTLGDHLDQRGYRRAFIDHYILPMGAALWSATPDQIRDFPALTFLRFFWNHGFLKVQDRPRWLVVEGGSARYVEAMMRPFRDRIRLSTPVRAIRREGGGVTVEPAYGAPQQFDAAVLAVHSDQALRMLADPSDDERRILGAIRYQPNEVVLHTDESLMPRRRRAWASWNYLIPDGTPGSVMITYFMNSLQGLRSRKRYFVTLNATDRIDPARVLARMTYEHPIFDAAAIAAQRERGRIHGLRDTWYCGAYWGYGFHEDGARSAHEAVEAMARERAA